MRLVEDQQLYKGVFWIINFEDMSLNKDYCFLIPIDSNGNVDSFNTSLNAKSGKTYNHERLWNTLPRSMTYRHDYNWFPRGRVEIQNGKATIYLNPNINTDEIRDFIIDEYNLSSYNGIKKIVFHSDGSEHYKCYLDD